MYISGKKGEGQPDEALQVAARRQSVAQLEVPKASFKDFFRFYSKLRNGKILFGTAMSWLLLDVSLGSVQYPIRTSAKCNIGCFLWPRSQCQYGSSGYWLRKRNHCLSYLV